SAAVAAAVAGVATAVAAAAAAAGVAAAATAGKPSSLDADSHDQPRPLTRPGLFASRTRAAAPTIRAMPAYACDACGACCRTWRVLVAEADAQREPRIRDEGLRLPLHLATASWSYQLFPLPFHDGCCFLDAQQRCGIYATRPGVCREFEPGGAGCQEA